MKRFGIKKPIAMVILLTGLSQVYGQTTCPTKNEIKRYLKDLVSQEFNVESISHFKDIQEICEVVIKIGIQPVVFYIDDKKQNIIVGNIIRLDNKENLTKKKQQEFMRFSIDQLSNFEKHVNVIYGEGEKYIYFITDPDCPFSKKSNQIIDEWSKKNNIQIKLIFLPLPNHSEAIKKSISVICDKKGFKEYIQGYQSPNQCGDGKKAVESNLSLMRKLGVNSTPTFIGMNGKIHIGVPTEEDLNRLIQ